MVAHEGMVLALGRCMVHFYAYDCVVRSGGKEWLQGALNVIVVLFRQYNLLENVKKTKAMT